MRPSNHINELTEAVASIRDLTPSELHPLLDAIVQDESAVDRAWSAILDGALDEG
jgi:hypothetical protein